MEKEIKDALNFMIGAATSVKAESEKIFGNIESNLKELSEKGAADQSELSNNIRKYTEEAFKEIDKLLTDARTRFDEVKAKAEAALPQEKK
jgi:pyruvate-formate lyase